jgi:hypothetical protein
MSRIGNEKWLRGRKNLVDPVALAEPGNIISNARAYLKGKSAPFPIDGLNLVSTNVLLLVNNDLSNFKDKFEDAVCRVEMVYPDAIDAARPILEEAGLYDGTEYPRDLAKFYDFKWQFLTLDTPKISSISPELYESEVRKFQETMKEARDMTSSALKVELSELINHMVERLNGEGKPKKFKDSLIGNFTEFLETLADRNLFRDRDLQDIANRAREVLTGVDPDDLRKYSDVQERVRAGMKELKEVVDEAIVDVPRRVISLKKAA